MPVLKVYKDGVWEEVSGVSGHSHSIDDIVDFPSSMPANGGNADTVDGKHADELQEKHISVTTTLSSSGWSSNSQTVTVDGVTDLNTIIVGAHPSCQDGYNESGVVCTTQGDSTLTFTCSETPTSDLQVNIIIFN